MAETAIHAQPPAARTGSLYTYFILSPARARQTVRPNVYVPRGDHRFRTPKKQTNQLSTNRLRYLSDLPPNRDTQVHGMLPSLFWSPTRLSRHRRLQSSFIISKAYQTLRAFTVFVSAYLERHCTARPPSHLDKHTDSVLPAETSACQLVSIGHGLRCSRAVPYLLRLNLKQNRVRRAFSFKDPGQQN